ncbi:MAG: VOC family protein [Acidobacteria bacterium]|nr:VOC family protein [Acidobacteriota bacterium]
MQNAISWFEIPVQDLERAKKFYEAIFGASFTTTRAGPAGPRLALFPVDPAKGVGGALAQGSGYSPTTFGTKVYLSAGEDLGIVLSRVEPAGGTVAVPKTQISPQYGFMGAFIDTEGNWVGLHSLK